MKTSVIEYFFTVVNHDFEVSTQMIKTYFFVSLGSAVLLVGFKTCSFKVQVVEAYHKALKNMPCYPEIKPTFVYFVFF